MLLYKAKQTCIHGFSTGNMQVCLKFSEFQEVKTVLKFMDGKTGTQFRFEPCGLGRHDIARVGYVYKLLH